VNIRTAGLMDEIELLKASVKCMSLASQARHVGSFLWFWDYTADVGSLEAMCGRASSQPVAE